ncbi:MAG TPA: hypothetical protein VL485_22095 [Ktedonobacteraceae bacterium]|jgi:hypothetical protein|nr:hypothetical protein [Ktedonobacteraceae bacterium]
MTRMISEHARTILLVLLLCLGLMFWTLHLWQMPIQAQHGYSPVHQHYMSCPPPPYDC